MSQSALNRLRVLFVDDEAPIRDVMKIELPRMGHEATICEDGSVAIAAIDKHSFDVAIVDLRMPGLSGWDVVDHIKKVSPDTEVIIVQGIGRYHRSGCILIRFMGSEDLESMTLRAAEEAGCVPCKACRPEQELADD